ncbi:MAG TPA: hormogonium polysaccharide biosynthesis protein HpsA [Nodularia sp. (in: cyanobacteria)]|nr:hormogonium polysaccharide biosynthesis protein HpsA [Nodularia sp. (in: cyanobacteria)]
MSQKRRLVKTIKIFFTRSSRNFISAIKKKLVWLLRTLFVTKRRPGSANAGFVLPTVAMVSVVAVLLTTAIIFRSFDRAQNASNVRVNEAVLSAATPAIDRGRAKLNKLFEDKTLASVTPSNDELYNALTGTNLTRYTFGDETPLKLQQAGYPDLETAWQFPVDTDNNGKFDSYSLYGIYFRTPPINNNNQYTRARNTLEARTPPTDKGTGGICDTAIVVGQTGWIKQNNKFNKSFFVYTATVPITALPSNNTANYETYTGNKSFAAVEYQQDRVQSPPNNYGVVYNDDLELTPDGNFNKLNGGIFTNSNLLNSGGNNAQIKLYQVSANASCFYEPGNAKIVVGGNSVIGGFAPITNSTATPPEIDLFQGKTGTVIPIGYQSSVTNSSSNTAYNNLAYENRIERLVTAQLSNGVGTDPSEVVTGITKRKTSLGLGAFTPAESDQIRREQLESYFKRRTRRVPFAEVALNAVDPSPSPLLQGSVDTLRPNDQWIYPTNPSNGKTGTGLTNLTLNIAGASLTPRATEPTELRKNGRKETFVGDRVLAGNNLPELWWDSTKNRFVGSDIEDTQNISGVTWDLPNATTQTRTRRSTAATKTLAEIGSTERDGKWELDAAKVPQTISDPVGGLRVVTGAGIYFNTGGTPSSFINTIKEIWPDTKPVPGTAPAIKTIKPYWMYAYIDNTPNGIGSLEYTWAEIKDDPTTPTLNEANTPYLRMRAMAVYHYTQGQGRTPIACVSSYYIPTNSTTAQNINTFAGKTIPLGVANGLSNNGIVYGPPTGTQATYTTALTYQSELRYPRDPSTPLTPGRLIDDGLLAKALPKAPANRTLSEQSAIDAQICALQILDGSLSPTNAVIPHGAIKETTFLDPREVKRNSGLDDILPVSDTYDRPIKDRQPLEIRATVLDLNQLRTKTIAGGLAQEYLLPNSGLIYATRDDALPDNSANSANSAKYSPLDFKLDPTRRPNGIMLVNGQKLWRTLNYREGEKGFILASNLPTYIKGTFNEHTKLGEFSTNLAANWSSNFYSHTAINPNFACRQGDPTKPSCSSDEWRPATVLADAVTLISNTFIEGFRDEGDYDWSQNPLTLAPPGFSKYNNFVTQKKWYDATGKPSYTSSYLNNFVTPIAIRTSPGSFLTEICPIETVNGQPTAGGVVVDVDIYCSNPKNWSIQTACGGGGGNTFYNGQIIGKNGHHQNSRLKTGYIFDPGGSFSNGCFDPNAPRRIAFNRNLTTGEILQPVQVLGASNTSNGQIGSFNFGNPGPNILPPPAGLESSVPFLNLTIVNGQVTGATPILQVEKPFATPGNPNNTTKISGTNIDTNKWLQQAGADTIFNVVVATGDSPARTTEDNGGLPNLIRFMENWQPVANTARKAIVSGVLMQLKKSAYATSPYNGAPASGYGITIDPSTNSTGFLPPAREWGYDVGLLSQPPDLFAQKLSLTPPDLGDEYFREVGRDDKWVKTLLCAKDKATGSLAVSVPGVVCN